jgi:hypothetical protein
MRAVARLSAALIVLSAAGFLGGRPCRAQIYGPYSLPRAEFYRYAPSYYPMLPNTTLGANPFYSPFWGPRPFFGGGPRYYNSWYGGTWSGMGPRFYGNRGVRPWVNRGFMNRGFLR